MKDILAWIDIETDGLKASSNILEIACIVTDTDLNPLDSTGYEAVVFYTENDSKIMRENALPVVQEMHTSTGLWGKLPQGKPLSVIENEVLDYIKVFAPEKRQARVAGSSVRADLNWIEYHMPSLYDHLHYRSIDVSTIHAIFEWSGIEAGRRDDHVSVHSAMSDINDSLMFAREYVSYIKRGNVEK